ncbi:TOG array regulator of axonemal microtubules like protein [Argiope bruennichi]|uniref:TOG array regulator of axonemal microtubules like protein n=2 Tax=Argiope bruennichi TaxID=94029 RepID=A0A8T0EJ04_ARGBR|nr:TOG array regulator of axonemal microtubules like protein [Argiope bruennichi]
MMNHMEVNDHLRSGSLSTVGRYSKNADSFVNHQECQVTSSCRNDNEMIRMQLRRLWKTLLSKNEKSRFEERKLCRSKTVKFLGDHIFSPCERVRYLALDLLCGTVPRLDDKTDSLLYPLASKVIQCLSENSSREVETKALHFLRTYARHTKSVRSFMDLFIRSGVESDSDAIRVNCLYGMNIIFDQDIGDKLYSHLVLAVSNFLKGNSHPLVFLTCYRVLKRIHEQIEDERFYKLLDLVNQEAKEIYINFLNYEDNDPYLNYEMEDLSTLISEYQRKRSQMRLNLAFGIIEPIFLNKISATRGCERAMMVNNFEVAIRRGSWTEYELESHVQDLIKLIAAFLIDHNRLIQISGLEILKEIIQKMGFHLSPFLSSIVEILLVPLTSSNIKIKSKAEKVLHKLMKNIHPMTVIWELLDERDSVYKEAVLIFLLDVLKCFAYYELDLPCLFVTIGQWMDDQNSNIRNESRDCIRLLQEIMESSPVPAIKIQAIGILLQNSCLQTDTLKSVGINVGESEESHEDLDSLSEISQESSEQSTVNISKSYTSVTRNSTTDQLQTQIPKSHRLSENNNSIPSSATPFDDSFLSYSGDMFCDTYVSKLTLKSTKTERQSHATLSVPLDSRGQLQSGVSHRTEDQSMNSASILTDTTYNHPYMGQPRHNSTPRKRWNVTPRDRQETILIASETTELPTMDTFESGNDTLLCQKASHQASFKNKASAKHWIQQNSKHYAFQYADGREWNVNYSAEEPMEYYEENCKGDTEAIIAKSGKKKTKTNERRQKDGDQTCTPSNGCYVESLDPKKFNFNILQISTPKTMESIEENDEETNEEGKIKITEVLSSCASTPQYSEVTTTKASETVNQLNIKTKKKKRQRSKFTAVRSPATTESEKTSTQKDKDSSCAPSNMKVLKAKGVVRSNKNKNASVSSIEESHFLQPEIISDTGVDETLDVTLQASCQESKDKTLSIKSESDINQEFLEDIDFDFDTEQEKEESLKKDDITLTVEDELIPDSEFSGDLDNTVIEQCDETIPDYEDSESENNKLKDSAQNESNIDTSETEMAKDSHLSTVDEENSENSSPWKKDEEITSGKGQSKINTKNKTKAISVEKTAKPKLKSILKLTRSTESSNQISEKKPEFTSGRKKTLKLYDKIFPSKNIQPDSSELDNPIRKTVDKQTTDTKVPLKIRKSVGKSTKKANINEFDEIHTNADDSLEDAIPWKKGKELPRTPVSVQGSTKISVLSRVKDGKKTSTELKINTVSESRLSAIRKIPEKKKTNLNEENSFPLRGKGISKHPKRRRKRRNTRKTTVENTPDGGNFTGCQWRKSKEEAMSLVIRLAKHHPETVYDHIPKIIVALCNEVKNFRQSVAGKAVLTLGYMYEYLGKKLESKLRLAVGALLAKSGNRTLAAYFRLVIKSLFKIVNSTSPQKVALAFIQEGGKHPNKASRETAAQFLALLTVSLGPSNSLASHILAGPMIKCAAQFVFDCSALTRHCGKRMFQVLMSNPNFEKLKEHHLDINTAQNLTKVLEQIETKGVSEEVLPIKIIK